jgi:hypothetical protein
MLPAKRLAGALCGSLRSALILVLLALLACSSTQQQAGPRVELPFASPLSGPGRPELEKSQQRLLRDAWKSMLTGQVHLANELAAGAGDLAPAQLLRYQIAFLDEAEPAPADLIEPLRHLSREHPDYAAAWITLSVIAERTGDEPLALQAAAESAQLWGKQPWAGRADQLHQTWVVGRIERAAELVAGGAAADGVELVESALRLAPEHRQGRLVKAEALIGLERVEEAEVLLAGMPGDEDALFLAGQIAEGRQDWLTAMEIYNSLPESYLDRDPALRRSQLQWHLSHMPEHVKSALESQQLNRAELALLMVALAPQLEGFGGSKVPLLSDIVDLPSYREILTAVRLGLIDPDPLEHRFYPERATSPAEVRLAVNGLCHLLGLPTPMWCEPEIVLSSPCVTIEEPVTGSEVAGMILEIVQREDP